MLYAGADKGFIKGGGSGGWGEKDIHVLLNK